MIFQKEPMLTDGIAIGNSMYVNIFAIPSEIKGVPTAKNSGGRTSPNNETPTAVVNKFSSKVSTDGVSRINRTSTKIVDPVTIKELRVQGPTLTATFGI